MKVKSSKGFTLAELLIVMAIIVVLAAVAIPTFGRQLETARETGDMENIRNAYSEALSLAILDVADGKLDGAKGGGGSLGVADKITITTVGSNHDEAIYAIKIDPIKQSGEWQYVNNVIAQKAVGTATKTYTWANFRFKMTDEVLALADSTGHVDADNTDPENPVAEVAAVGIDITNTAKTS